MKIIRWLLSHLFLILLIVVVIYGYMFWGNLAGKDTPAGKALAYLSHEFVEVEEFINAVKEKQGQLSAEQTSHEPMPSEPAPSEPLPSAASAEETVASSNVRQTPVSISYSHNQMQVRQNSSGDYESQAARMPVSNTATRNSGQKQRAEPAPVVTEAANAQDKFVSTAVEQQLDNVDNNGKVIDKSLPGDAVRESWITARKSFYQRKYELSEKSYHDVIDNTTDNFDAYGELGNVYFNQGKNEKAAQAYFEAASILVRMGEARRAQSLMGLLRHLDKNRADDLQKLIESSAS